jgi:conjugal transfer pilus assembly protein TraV
MLGPVVGCSTLNPYHSEFMCAATENHGKCESVNAAYTEALDKKTARKQGATMPDVSSSGKAAAGADPALIKTAQMSGEERYHEAEYRKLAALVEEPVMPIVQQPTVLRTLILSYPAGDSLYMPRYVMYFADAPKFVIGEYLNPLSTPKTVYPNGVN